MNIFFFLQFKASYTSGVKEIKLTEKKLQEEKRLNSFDSVEEALKGFDKLGIRVRHKVHMCQIFASSVAGVTVGEYQLSTQLLHEAEEQFNKLDKMLEWNRARLQKQPNFQVTILFDDSTNNLILIEFFIFRRNWRKYTRT